MPVAPVSVFQNPYSSVANSATPSPSLGQTIKEGLAFGTGSAIAHRIFNPFPTVQPTPTAPTEKKPTDPCQKERYAFEVCMKTTSIDTYCSIEQSTYAQCIRDTAGSRVN